MRASPPAADTPWVSPDSLPPDAVVTAPLPTDEQSPRPSRKAFRPAGERVDSGTDSARRKRRDKQAELNKGPVIGRRVATTALIWSGVIQIYEVLSNMLNLPGWVWGVAGFIVTSPDVWSRAKDAIKSWKGKR